MNDAPNSTNYIDMAADIVSAFVSHNSVRTADLPELITSVHSALANLGSSSTEQPKEELRPPVSIKKSLTPDYIISLEDGRQYKSLKRHLTGRGLTPDQYREKWSLPRDYPMVAPKHAKRRSELAKSLGLGQLRRNAAQAKAAAPDETVASAPVRRGRKKAA